MNPTPSGSAAYFWASLATSLVGLVGLLDVLVLSLWLDVLLIVVAVLLLAIGIAKSQHTASAS